MSEGIVDHLEPVEVEEKDRKQSFVTLRMRQRLVEDLFEQLPVGKTGQGIVISHLQDKLVLLPELPCHLYVFEELFDCGGEFLGLDRFQHVVIDAEVDAFNK